MKSTLTAIIEKTTTGFSGYIKELDGMITVGSSISEMKENFSEILALNEMVDYNIEYVVDLGQFFDYYDVLNKSAFADYIGMNRSLFRQYTRGLTKLSDNKLLDITKGLHKLADDFSDIALIKN